VDDLVLDRLHAHQDVADQPGIARDAVAQGILHGPDRVHGVHDGADAADSLSESPGVAGIAVLEDFLDAAKHGAAAVGADDMAIRIHIGLDVQMAFDAGDGIDDDSGHGVCS
jgi:hypothetical protein